MDLQDLPQSLIDVLRGYAVLCPTKYLNFEAGLDFAQVHEFLVNRLLCNPHFMKYPPSSEYQRIFWKWAVSCLENLQLSEDDEIDARLYEHSISLLQATASPSQAVGAAPPAPSYFTYMWSTGSSIKYETATLLESRTTIESGTTGMKTWRASLVLAQYLLQHGGIVRGKSILELGCGVGFLGLVLSAIQLSDPTPTSTNPITLTDLNPGVLARCEENLALSCNASSTHPSLHTQQLDWTDALQPTRRPHLEEFLSTESAELVVGADVVFDPSIIPALVETLSLALSTRDRSIGLIALTVRNEDTVAEFLNAAKRSLTVEDVPFAHDEAAFWGIAESTISDRDQTVRIFKFQNTG
ncbi:hypothetical protein BDW22DRAFT_1479856 [Trametopsis cervina]|nr:hypothetical protein BDW22DRAFT_1479856 [Trametopsis cervina]